MLSSFHKPMKHVGVTPCTALVVTLLCLSVFMQMLGAPVTLWDVDNTIDVDYLSFLEGFAIPADSPLIGQAVFLSRDGGGTSRPHSLLRDHSLFRPPTSLSVSRV
jgi:hypothetical protein